MRDGRSSELPGYVGQGQTGSRVVPPGPIQDCAAWPAASEHCWSLFSCPERCWPSSALPQLPPLPRQVQTLGKERSFEGYQALLSRAGFDPARVHFKRTGAYLDALIAYK